MSDSRGGRRGDRASLTVRSAMRRRIPVVAAAMGTAAVAVGAVSVGRSRRRRSDPAAPGPPLGSIGGTTSTIAGPDGVQVTVEAYGDEDAPQLVLVHGWLCTGRVWHEQVTRLAARWRVITYDQPGHGRSSAPASGTYDLDLLGDTLLRVLEQATAPGPVVVMGHSLGAMGLLNAVRRAPRVRDRLAAVVLLSTTSSPTLQHSLLETGVWVFARAQRLIERLVSAARRPRPLRIANRAASQAGPAALLLTRWLAVGRNPDPEVVRFTMQQLAASDVDLVFGYAVAIAGVAEDAGLDALTEIPVTIAGGTHDRLTPHAFSRQMAARVADRTTTPVTLVTLPGAGHMSPLEAPDEVTALAEEHLRALAARMATSPAQRTDTEAG